MPLIVPAYAAVFGLMFAVFSFRVANTRRMRRISLGTGGDRQLERYIRVQGNFIEYVPITLILLTFLELQAWPAWLVHLLCASLLIARVLHALGIGREPDNLRLRAPGMVVTLTVLIVTSVLLLVGGVWRGLL